MASFADAVFFFAMIVFVFALLPALRADRRWRRTREGLLAVNADIAERSVLWRQDRTVA